MLDDLKYIHTRDKSDALGIAEKQWQQLTEEPKTVKSLASDHIYNVVFNGMGGSALAALIAKSWPIMQEPFEINRDYNVPDYVDSDTLFIASSYSGNTEETLSALALAEEQGAQIAVITAGGKLEEIARAKGYALYLLPTGLQPRYATLYSYRALLALLGHAQLINAATTEKKLVTAAELLKKSVLLWSPTIPTHDNQAKKLALELLGSSPVIYAGPLLYPAAYKWKISINENAKNIAWCNQFPEFNHNEFLGWSSHPIDKPYRVIYLESSFEHERVQKRFAVTERMLSGRWPSPIHITAEGSTLLEQLLWTVALGDFVSLYLALLNGIDPTPVDLIEKFKSNLAD